MVGLELGFDGFMYGFVYVRCLNGFWELGLNGFWELGFEWVCVNGNSV